MRKRKKVLFPMTKREWGNLRKNWWLKLALLVIIFIPVIYTAIFLGSMWDPYGNTDKIPVAVVNEDRPVRYQGEKLSAGKDTVNELLKNKEMDFRKADSSQAYKGLKEGKYYMVIKIPENFSENATTLMDEHPEKMVIEYLTNPGKNYIASKLDESAIQKIKDAVSSSVTQTYAKTMFDSVDDLGRGLADGSEAAEKLHKGALKLSAGNNKLASGIVTLADSSVQLSDGAGTLKNGISQYTKGVSRLSDGAGQLDSGITELSESSSALSDGVIRLADGSSTLNSGIKKYTDGVSDINSGLSQLSMAGNDLNRGAASISENTAKLAAAAAQLKQAASVLPASDPRFAQLIAATEGISQGLDGLKAGTSQFSTSLKTYTGGVDKAAAGAKALNENSENLVSGSNSLNEGINALYGKMPDLKSGIGRLSDGAGALSHGAVMLDSKSAQLNSGADALYEGTRLLDDGTGKLKEGSSQLTDGFSQLTDGTGKLSSGLSDGAEKSSIKTNDNTVKMFAEPVETKDTEISTVKNNGSAMAPYMMSVALFVAAMAFTLMYPLLNNVRKAKSGLRYWAGKASVMYTVSTLAAIVMIQMLIMLNGLDPVQKGMTFLFAILVAAAFMSMIVFFNAAFGRIGEFLMLIYMVVNLGGSAGTYPLETSAPWFNSIHPYVPFTYSVDGFRNVISMDDPSLMMQDIHMMLIMIVSFAAATIIYYSYRRKNPEPLLKQAFPDE